MQIIKTKDKRLQIYILGCNLGWMDRKETLSVYGKMEGNNILPCKGLKNCKHCS